jgi:hypothetical protein
MFGMQSWTETDQLSLWREEEIMKRTQLTILAAVALSTAALAQGGGYNSGTPVTGQTIEQRKDNQQQRIGNGMENGSLTAGESSRLEKQEHNLNKEERGMRGADDGKLTPADKAKLNRQQNQISRNIYRDKHNGINQPKANNEVNARDRMQQERIGQGVKSGSLTPKEASNLERKEANLNREQRNMRSANGGKLTPGEKAKINRQQNGMSKQIYRKKHNNQKQG